MNQNYVHTFGQKYAGMGEKLSITTFNIAKKHLLSNNFRLLTSLIGEYNIKKLLTFYIVKIKFSYF